MSRSKLIHHCTDWLWKLCTVSKWDMQSKLLPFICKVLMKRTKLDTQNVITEHVSKVLNSLWNFASLSRTSFESKWEKQSKTQSCKTNQVPFNLLKFETFDALSGVLLGASLLKECTTVDRLSFPIFKRHRECSREPFFCISSRPT